MPDPTDRPPNVVLGLRILFAAVLLVIVAIVVGMIT